MHASSFAHMQNFKEKYLSKLTSDELTIFDLGSMDVNGTYREIFDNPAWHYRGLDLAEGKNVDIVLKNTYSWKEIKTDSVDVLISGQAFEHMEFFWITMLEVARVLKPGGLCCIIAPSSGFEHRYPVDCWRFYSDGFSALARFARLKVLEVFSRNKKGPKDNDEKDLWKDTVMICRKYRLPFFYALRQRIWRKLMHWVLIRRLPL